jgi:hypothetical protein
MVRVQVMGGSNNTPHSRNMGYACVLARVSVAVCVQRGMHG